MNRLSLLALLIGAVPGCGLIDADIADFDLSLPPKEFVLDTAQWGIGVDDEEFPAIDCSNMEGICSAGATGLCGGTNCFASCGNDSNCELLVQIQLWSTINLVEEKPELAEIEDQPIVSVTIDRIWFNVLDNTLNIDAPELGIFVAPASVMSTGSPQAQQVGTIPAVMAQDTFMDGEMDFTADGQEQLKDFMKDYKTPFNFLIGSTVDVRAGEPVPSGMLRVEVNVDAHAGL